MLDSNNPETRQQAAAQLQQSGTAAIDALKRLEKSKIQQVAQRAKEVTQNPNSVPLNRFGNRAIQMQAIRLAIANAQKNIRKNNQNKELKKTVKDGNKTIEIRETPNKEIAVKIIEKIDGKEKVTETKAKNIIELRKKNREAYDMYRKHKPKQPQQQLPLKFDNLQRGNIRIVVGGAAGNMEMKQTSNNGQRHTEVMQNGRKIEIDDLNNTNIVIKITETKNGKETTTEVKAKNLRELKKKHPQAAREYEKYNKNGGVMQIRVFGDAGNLPPNFPVLPPNIKEIQMQQKKIMEEMIKRIEEQQKEFEEMRKKIEEQQGKLEKGIKT